MNKNKFFVFENQAAFYGYVTQPRTMAAWNKSGPGVFLD
jgi:hypothetical protein